MKVIESGTAIYHPVDPDGHRAYLRDHRSRAMTSKLMDEHEAISRFVENGDYLVYDCNYLMRGPASLMRELMRQRKQDLWLAGKFTYVDVALLVGAGTVSRIDVGFFLTGNIIDEAIKAGKVQLFEYSNVTMTLRLRAGAQGLPFVPVRGFGGTDGFTQSGAKLVEDPFTGKPITLLPALNPDVAIVHAHQADEFGNARIFGTGIAHVESALASKKVIISAEEIVSVDEMRRNPGLNSIPYYAVDAVVEAPFGAFPGNCAGYYTSDREHTMEIFGAINRGQMPEYLDKWVYSVASHMEMMEQRVGLQKMQDLRRQETIREGYHA